MDEAGGFERPGALETPAIDGHGFDEVEFVGRDGVEAVDVVGDQFVEFVLRFAGEDDGLGCEAVGEAVAGGDEFAAWGFGAGGFLGVGPVSGETLF